jgi:hypothetical protein
VPILTYAVESWYPAATYFQKSIERIKKYAAKLSTNDFSSTYTALLEQLEWKPISQVAMERRVTYVCNHVKGRLPLPDNAKPTANRRSLRLGHGMELQPQTTHLYCAEQLTQDFLVILVKIVAFS